MQKAFTALALSAIVGAVAVLAGTVDSGATAPSGLCGLRSSPPPGGAGAAHAYGPPATCR